MIRKRIVFNGWVQGVGFRYRARRAADLLGVTGWVRNEYDGSVTMEIQGSQAIGRGRSVKIESMDVEIIPVIPGEHDFRTRF